MFSRLLEVARDRAGAAIVEFAIVLPLLAVTLLGILQVGFFFFEIVQVQNAAAIGLRQLLASRPVTISGQGPYSSTQTAIQAATNLPSLTFTVSVGGTTCASDTACSPLLAAALAKTGSYATAQTASVTVSNRCLTLLPVSWVNSFCPNGVLQATYTQRVD
jgi:Flp pilus assembly protein TadG